MAGKKYNMTPMWKKLKKDVDLDEPTSSWSCILGMHSSVNANRMKYLWKNAKRCSNPVFLLKQRKNCNGKWHGRPWVRKDIVKRTRRQRAIVTHKVQRLCQTVGKITHSSLKTAVNIVMWKRHVDWVYFKSAGYLEDSKSLWMGELARQRFRWMQLWSVTKCTHACARRLAKLISHIHLSRDCRQYCHVEESQHNIVDWVYFKTETLLVTLRMAKSRVDLDEPTSSWSCILEHREEFYVCLEVVHLFLWMSEQVGCARS